MRALVLELGNQLKSMSITSVFSKESPMSFIQGNESAHKSLPNDIDELTVLDFRQSYA